MVNFNGQFARKLTTLEFKEKLTNLLCLCVLVVKNEKGVREDTYQVDKENILLQIIWASPKLPRVGLFVTFPMNQEISTAIPHAKPIAVKKCQLYVCPGQVNPMARMPIKHHYFLVNSTGRRNSGAEPNRRTTEIAFQKNRLILLTVFVF